VCDVWYEEESIHDSFMAILQVDLG